MRRPLRSLSCSVGILVLLSASLSVAVASPSGTDPDKDADSKKPAKAKDEPAADKPKAEAAKPEQKPAESRRRRSRPTPKPVAKATVADWVNLGVNLVASAKDVLGFNNRNAPAAVQFVGGMNAQQFEQQYGPRMKSVLKAELHFVRVVCKPTRQQFEKIAGQGDKDLQASIKTCAEKWVEMQQGRGNSQPLDPHKILIDDITKSVKAHLTADQAARYQKELELREGDRKKLAIRVIVESMDKKLFLSPEQRDKLTPILEKGWQPSWSHLQMLMQVGYYYPAMPDDKIVPILTENQKTVWNGVQKGIGFGGFELDWVASIEVADEIWPAEEEKKKQ